MYRDDGYLYVLVQQGDKKLVDCQFQNDRIGPYEYFPLFADVDWYIDGNDNIEVFDIERVVYQYTKIHLTWRTNIGSAKKCYYVKEKFSETIDNNHIRDYVGGNRYYGAAVDFDIVIEIEADQLSSIQSDISYIFNWWVKRAEKLGFKNHCC